MEIKSNMKHSYLRNYNEAKGIAVNKKIVLKKQTNKVLTYLESCLITILLLSIFIILFNLLNSPIVRNIFIIFLLIYILYSIIRTIWSINFKRKQDYHNTITIDENGLTDHSFYNIRINIIWDKIPAIVVKKHTITFLTDTHLFFFFDISKKEEIINLVKKYSKNTLIIE